MLRLSSGMRVSQVKRSPLSLADDKKPDLPLSFSLLHLPALHLELGIFSSHNHHSDHLVRVLSPLWATLHSVCPLQPEIWLSNCRQLSPITLQDVYSFATYTEATQSTPSELNSLSTTRIAIKIGTGNPLWLSESSFYVWFFKVRFLHPGKKKSYSDQLPGRYFEYLASCL